MASKNSTSSPTGRQRVQRSDGDSARWIFGLLLLFTGIFVAASVIFSLFSWANDQSILQGVGRDNPMFNDTVDNLCGRGGAWLGEQIVGRSFGLFGLLLPVMIVLVGVRIIRQRPLLFNHSVLLLFVVMILGSLSLGFFFDVRWSLCSSSGWGGAYGIEASQLLKANIGVVGTFILLLGSWILTGVFINRNFINTVNTAGNAMVDKSEKLVDIVRSESVV